MISRASSRASGGSNVLAEFSQRQIDYFHASAYVAQGHGDASATERSPCRTTPRPCAHSAIWMRPAPIPLRPCSFSGVCATAGDRSEATTLALGARLRLFKAQILDNKNDAAGPAAALRARGRSATAARRVPRTLRWPHDVPISRRSSASVSSRSQTFQSMRKPFARSARPCVSPPISVHVIFPTSTWGPTTLRAAPGWYKRWIASGTTTRRGGQVKTASRVADQVFEQRPAYRLALHAQQIVIGSHLASWPRMT